MAITQDEIEAAMAAYATEDKRVEGTESGKARQLCWKAALEAAEFARWQPIETAPKDGTPILLDDGGMSEVPTVCFWRKQEWLVCWDHSKYGKAISWQPLPSPPESK